MPDLSKLDDEKRVAAEAAAELVESGMRLGLGTGSTVAHLLPAIARRELTGVVCVSTSPATEQLARELGLATASFGDITTFDLAIDGADQVRSDWWLVKGGGAAHTREKLVAAAAARFVVIIDSSKTVDYLRAPIPLELLPFGLDSTLARIRDGLGDVDLRDVPASPDGGVIADYRGEIGDPAQLAARLSSTPGVVEHGLFPPEMVSAVCVGRGGVAVWLERH
jgi:ribose 5-phosphate isomerase A